MVELIQRLSVHMWLLRLSVLILFVVPVHAQTGGDKAVHLCGRVVDQSSGTGISGARISLQASMSQRSWRSDSFGRFSFWVPIQPNDKLEVEQDGYDRVMIPAQATGSEIRLMRISSASVSNHLDAANLPPEIMAPSQSVAPAIVTADSGVSSSGRGKKWSRWYRLEVGRAPNGYTLLRSEFWLSGDRSCGFFAECREIVRNDRHIVWEFRLQGHDEPGAPKQTNSVGHVRALYRAL